MPDLPFDASRFIRAVRGINRVYAFGYQRLRLRTPCTLPTTGPAIVICNHVSGLDPFLLQSTCPRIIRWMMAKEYFDLPRTRGLCEKLGFIPVARAGRDSASLKAGLRALRDGQIVGIFPEGKINDRPTLLPFQPGVALLALRSGAPVHPVSLRLQHYHSMVYPALEPQCPEMMFGKPFIAAGDLEQATDQMRSAVAHLAPPQQHLPVTCGRWF